MLTRSGCLGAFRLSPHLLFYIARHTAAFDGVVQ